MDWCHHYNRLSEEDDSPEDDSAALRQEREMHLKMAEVHIENFETYIEAFPGIDKKMKHDCNIKKNN